MTYLFTDIDGNVSRAVPGGTTRQPVPKPTGVTRYYPLSRPTFARYALINGTRPLLLTYINGQFNKMMVWTPQMSLFTAGIQAPTVAPTMAATGSGGLTGGVIASFAWAQYQNNILIHQGNPSPKTATVAFASKQVQISNIPATAPDPRTTHWIVYLSVDGSLSHKAAVYPLGATGATFDISNAELFTNPTLPIFLDDDGNPLDDVLARGVPPYAQIIGFWHQRLWYVIPGMAGVFYSALNEPESVNEDLDRSYIPTPGGEYPLSLGIMDNELVVFCEEVAYSIQGFGETSFTINKINDGVRFIAPFSPVTIQGVLFFASDQGICVYAGGGGNSFRNVMSRSLRDYWIELLAANPMAYQGGIASDDRVYGDYVFAPDTSTTLEWRGYYRPMAEEGEPEPWWHIDRRNRRDRVIGQLFYPDTHRGLIAYGECDGKVRWDDPDNADDDGDTYQKKFFVQTKHFFMGDQGGDWASGRVFTNIDWFGRLDASEATLTFYAGDDSATADQVSTKTQIIKLKALVQGQLTYPTSLRIAGINIAGKGLGIGTTIYNPVDKEYRGVAISYTDGPQTER